MPDRRQVGRRRRRGGRRTRRRPATACRAGCRGSSTARAGGRAGASGGTRHRRRSTGPGGQREEPDLGCRSRGEGVELLEVVLERVVDEVQVRRRWRRRSPTARAARRPARARRRVDDRARLRHHLEARPGRSTSSSQPAKSAALRPNGAHPSPSSTARCERAARPAADPERHVLVDRVRLHQEVLEVVVLAVVLDAAPSHRRPQGPQGVVGPLARAAASGPRAARTRAPACPRPTPSTSRPPEMRSRVP